MTGVVYHHHHYRTCIMTGVVYHHHHYRTCIMTGVVYHHHYSMAAAAAAMVVRAAAAAALLVTGVECGLACISNPCAHGVCVDQLNSSSYSCFCVDGYTGLRCQTNWDDCWSAPCRNGATCVDLVAALTCICPPGYTGEFCEAEVNECQSDPCQNNGTCHDLLNHYICTCPPGYSGVNCEVDVSVCNTSSASPWPSHNPRCFNGGQCVDGPGLSYTCLCQPGWMGRRCELDLDECWASPCQNAAVCINTPGSFACACQFGFTGPLCEEAVVFCEANPCQNGALCVMEEHNATCYCVPDYHGAQCQDQYNDCLPYAPRCFNGGECIDGVDSFLCSCPNSTSGDLCQCATTAEGQVCEELPLWYEDKPYQAIGPTKTEIFHHWFNISHSVNESVTDYLPSPTSTDEVYVYSTSSVDLSPYDLLPSGAFTPSSELVSSVLVTAPRLPKDFSTPSSVISAKKSSVYSEPISASVPYSSSELYDAIFPSASLFPSSMEWSESLSMQPTPVLPVPPSSVAPEDSLWLSSEYPISTSVPHIGPTHLLEGSFTTPSAELVSLSLVFGVDVSTTSVFDSVSAVEPTPVLSLASSLLVPVTSDLVGATSASPASPYDLVNATFLPGDDGDGNQTLTSEASLASAPLTPTPEEDTSVTEDLLTASSLPTELPGNDTTYPAEGVDVTEVSPSADTEPPVMITLFNVSISGEDFTDPAFTSSTEFTTLQANVTDQYLDISTSVSVTYVTTSPPMTTSTEDQETGGPTYPEGTPSATPPPDYEDTGGTTPETDGVSPTDAPLAPYTPHVDTEPSVLTPSESGVDMNLTTIDVDEYDEYNVTHPVPSDEYNKTVTVPPDLETTVETPPTVESMNVTENETLFETTVETVVTVTPPGTPAVTPITHLPSDRPPTDLTIYENFTREITSFFGTETTEMSSLPETSTTDVTLLNESTSVTESVPYNESFTTPFTLTDLLFTTGLTTTTTTTTTNASYTTTDTTPWNVSLTTTATVLNDSLPTELTTYDTSLTTESPRPQDSTTAVSMATDILALTTSSYVTEGTTINDSLTVEQTTPDQFYVTVNDTYTAKATTYRAETSSETLASGATLTDAPWPATDASPAPQRTVGTSVAPEVITKPSVVTSESKDDTRSTTTSVPPAPATTRLADVFTVVTEELQDFENVTIPDEEFLYTASETGVSITRTAAVSSTPSAAPRPSLPEESLLLTSTGPPTTEGRLGQTSLETGEPSAPTPLTTLPPPTTLTTAAPAATFQVPEALTPVTLVAEVNMTTEAGDHTASSSVEIPVFNTTSQRPREPPTLPSEPHKPSVSPATGTETQSDQPAAVACGAGYCLNGGTCVVRGGNFSCECPFDRRGPSCEVYFYINKPYFVGASFLGVAVGNMSLRRGVQVYVQFTSQDPNGLVAYSEGPGDAFFMLLLRNSLLQFVFSCGLQTVSFLQGNEKLTRNYQTDVSVRMWWTPYQYDTPWGPGMCSASMQVNGTAPVYSEQRSWSPWVRLGLLYLGGLPTSYSSPLVVKAGFLPRLNGCISLLEVNGREVDMWVSSVAGERVEECGAAPCPPGSCFNGGSCVPGPALWSCQCPRGYQGELCEQAECEGVSGPCHSGRCIPTHRPHPLCLCPTHRHGLYCELERVVERPSYSGTVSGYSSYTAYRLDYDATFTTAVRLHFTTRALRQVGLLAYLGNTVRSATQDFLALSLVRGYLLLTWDLGAGPRRIMTPEPLDTTLHTHSALIGRRGRRAWLVVDSQRNVSASAPGYLSSLNTNNILYIGGHPSWNMSHLPADMWRHEGFRGCVFDLRVAATSLGPWTALRIAGSANVKECGEDECRHDSCSNGGTCVGLGATIRCECPVGWKGPRCEVASHICEGGGSCAPGASCLASGSLGGPPTCLCQIGQTGQRCDKAINITDPQFSGDGSYLSLRSRSLRRESLVTVSFRPTRPDGLLFLALPRQPPGDFMGLALINGTLQFTYHLGWRAPGLVVVRSEASARLQEWQTVKAWRRGGQGTLTFRGRTTRAAAATPATHSSSAAATTLLDVHNEVFVGGAPDLSVVPPSVAPQESRVPYRGCVRQVMINSVDHDLRVPGGEVVRGAGLADCDGTACGHQVCLHGGTCTPAGDTFVCACPQEYTGVRCQLSRACLDHSCVNGGTCVPSDASAGSKKRRHVVSGKESPSQRKVDAFRYVRDAAMEEDHVKGEEGLVRGEEQTNTSEEAVGATDLALSDGDGVKDTALTGGDAGAFTEEEQSSKREVGGSGGENGTSSSSHHYCICPPGYVGTHCQTASGGELGWVRFSGRSFAVVPEDPFGTPAPDVDSLALNFSTTATHGLLLWRGQVDAPGEDFLGVGVSGGRIKVVWHLGGGGIGHLATSRSVRDGRWHSLVVSRTGAVVTIFLDGDHHKTSSPGTYTQINDPHGLIFVGGFPGKVSVSYGTEGHFQRAFVGCLRDLIVHQGSSPIRFSALTRGQDLQPCS
ncbi:uncharacterized protein eys [Panulirus ornatus]|uniref:uncharacterized protein eys n=1 Tax=Panulirus ornatus TaxID=150431 RepID=UPI003A84213D